MRAALVLASACALMGCGRAEERREAADAQAAASGFTPPSVVSRLDWGGQVERRFRSLDRDQSGRLEEVEWPRVDVRFAARDQDGDRVVSAEEFSQAALARFDRMDINKDGTVTAEERRTTRDGAAPAG